MGNDAQRRRAREQQFDDFFLGEGVAVEVQTANIGLRIASALIDLAIIAFTMIAFETFIDIFFHPQLEQFEVASQVVIHLLVFLTSALFLPMLFEILLDGRTVGKLAVGTRAVRTDHGALSIRHSAVRALTRVAEFLFFNGLPSLICMFATARTVRLGDLAAGTLVIRDRVPLPLPITPQIPIMLQQWVTRTDLGTLPADLSLRIRILMQRSGSMDPQSLLRQSEVLAREAAPYVLPPPPAGTPALPFLQAITAERCRRDSLRLQRNDALARRVLPPLGEA